MFYNILIKFHIPTKLNRLIKTCITLIESIAFIGKHLSHVLHVRNGLKKEDALLLILSNLFLEQAIRKVGENGDGLESNGMHQRLF
jgi:hypothetical protein